MIFRTVVGDGFAWHAAANHLIDEVTFVVSFVLI
jgi:hypothetical protein